MWLGWLPTAAHLYSGKCSATPDLPSAGNEALRLLVPQQEVGAAASGQPQVYANHERTHGAAAAPKWLAGHRCKPKTDCAFNAPNYGKTLASTRV